jgi:hypothetical protein
MREPPESLDGARVLAWAWSGEAPFGVVRSGEDAIEVRGLAVCRYPGATSVYRFACDGAWAVQQDATYADVDEAKRSVPAQYVGRVPIIWQSRAG